MISMFKKSLLALSFVFANFVLIEARTVSECRIQLREIAQSLVEQNVYNPQINSLVPKISSLIEEDLIDLCDLMLLYRKDLESIERDVEAIREYLITYLKSFVATGMDVQVDPNFAFIYDEQNPDFNVTFKNPAGEVKMRKYALKIWSYGLKFEFAIKIDGITIIGNNFNYYDANKDFKLGSGVDVGVTAGKLGLPLGCSVAYFGIQNTNCAILVLGIDFGVGNGLSYVSGGEMTLVNE